MSALLLMLAIVALVAISQRSDQRHQLAVRDAMSGLLTGRGRATVDELALMVRENKQYLGHFHRMAGEAWKAADYETALQRLRLGCDAIETLAPDFLTALRALRRLTRTVSFIVDVEPARPSAYRVWRLRGLAAVGVMLHHLLVTGRQRVAMRLQFVILTFRLAVRWLRSATTRLTPHPSRRAATEWRRIDGLVADLGVSGDEAVVVARHVVEALDAVSLRCPAAQRTF